MIKIHNFEQGSDEWHQARCGLLTASEMKLIITPGKLQPASNDKERAHLYELVAQRITGYVEPHYYSDDMLRGKADEVDARDIYASEYEEVLECGFITNDKWGFTLGYSPDGLVGLDGTIECKSRRQRFQIETIVKWEMPDDFMIQVQTGLLVSERKWCDFISYSAGLPMATIRIPAHPETQAAILKAAEVFEAKAVSMVENYGQAVGDKNNRLIPTERKIEQEITI